MNREEHLQWCKDRANALVDAGEVKEAYASMCSDMNKHKDTKGHSALGLGVTMIIAGLLDHPDKMRDFINGFN